jgi:hypothetical protein
MRDIYKSGEFIDDDNWDVIGRRRVRRSGVIASPWFCYWIWWNSGMFT